LRWYILGGVDANLLIPTRKIGTARDILTDETELPDFAFQLSKEELNLKYEAH